MNAPTYPPRMAQLLSHLNNSTEVAAKYRKLAERAGELGMGYEVERLTREADYFESDAEDIRDRLVALGYSPDDDDDDSGEPEGKAIAITGHPTATHARRSSISDLWHLLDAAGETVDVVRRHLLPEYLTVGQHADLLGDEAIAARGRLGYSPDDDEDEAAALCQEAVIPTRDAASRCAADLRNRGFKVATAADGRTLLVETPAGWTGTSAADVVKQGHGGSMVGTVPAGVFDIVAGRDEAAR
jgi:hypothetical protein